jgi:hypothetical protein
MCSQSNPPLYNSALDGSGSELLANAAEPKLCEATSDRVDTDFLEGYISEPDYARRRDVTLRTCQRDRQLRKAPPYIKIGRQIFYRVDALRDWMLKQERCADPVPAARWRRTRR